MSDDKKAKWRPKDKEKTRHMLVEIVGGDLTDDDNPEWTEEMIADARPANEVFAELGITPPKPIGRPKGSGTKVPVTIRLDKDIVERFKATGKGWQSRMNEALKDASV